MQRSPQGRLQRLAKRIRILKPVIVFCQPLENDPPITRRVTERLADPIAGPLAQGGRQSEVDNLGRGDLVALKQLYESLDRFNPWLNAIGIENDVRHLGGKMLRKNPSEPGGRVDGQRMMMDPIVTPLEQKHLNEIRIGQNRDRVPALR
jgi:hypothetical protein